MLEHCCGSFWQTGTPHTGLLPPSMCSLQDSGVINTFTHKTTVIPAFLQGSEVPCVTKLSNSSLAASSTPGSALFIKGRPTSAFAVVTVGLDFLFFRELCCCHQALCFITKRHQRRRRNSSRPFFVPTGKTQICVLG